MSVKTWGHGPEAALMLHCTLAQGGAWAGVARHLLGHFTMTAPDLLSHGAGPDYDPARDFHDHATQEAARHLPPNPVHLIGHFFGATLALRLALDHPARVKTLTLIEPVLFCAAHGPGRVVHDDSIADVPKTLSSHTTAIAARIFLGLWGSEPFDAMPAPLQTYIKDRMWIPAACAPALESDRAQILPRLQNLMAPTLLLQGANSPPVIAEIIAHLADEIPNSQQHTIENAAHMAPLTHPQDTAAAILCATTAPLSPFHLGEKTPGAASLAALRGQSPLLHTPHGLAHQ